jgi:hypothetical protein
VDEVDEKGDLDATTEVMTVAIPSAVGLTAEEDLYENKSLCLKSEANGSRLTAVGADMVCYLLFNKKLDSIDDLILDILDALNVVFIEKSIVSCSVTTQTETCEIVASEESGSSLQMKVDCLEAMLVEKDVGMIKLSSQLEAVKNKDAQDIIDFKRADMYIRDMSVQIKDLEAKLAASEERKEGEKILAVISKAHKGFVILFFFRISETGSFLLMVIQNPNEF